MAYESTEALKRRIESLSTPVFSGQGAGLANAIRSRRSNKYSDQLSEVEKRNEANRAQELAMLLRGAETGRVGDFVGAATLDQAKFTDPTIQGLAAELRLKKASSGKEGPIVVPAGSRLYEPNTRQTLLAAMPDNEKGSTASYGTSLSWGKNAEGKYVPFQASTLGGLQPASIPEGVEMLPGAGIMGFDPSLISPRMGAQTEALVDRENQLGDIETQQEARGGVIKSETDRYYEAIPKAEAAYATIRSMDQFINASPNSPEGSLAGVFTGIKNLVASLGGNPDGLTDTMLMESARAGSLAALMNQMGARSMSEGDRVALEKALPSIGTSQEARVAVANIIKSNAERALSEFSQLDDARRKDPMSGKYMMPLPWLDSWKQSSQPQTGSRFEVIENR